MEILFHRTQDIKEFGKIIGPLLPEFGPIFCQTVLEWCDIIPCERNNYWLWFLVYVNDKPVGCCGLYSLNRSVDELWLAWFGLIPEYRNHGIGSKCLDYLEKISKTLGCKVLRSYVDKEGKPLEFYRRNGFNVNGTVKEFLEKNKLQQIDGDNFEDPDDFIIEKILI